MYKLMLSWLHKNYLFTINVEFYLVVCYHVAAENVAAGVGQYPKSNRRQPAAGGMEERSTSRGLCTDLFVFCMQGKSLDYSRLLYGWRLRFGCRGGGP